jgi:hypothetical protein
VRWASIAGQPFVFTTWNDDETVREMIDFAKWWLSSEIQIEFAKRVARAGAAASTRCRNTTHRLSSSKPGYPQHAIDVRLQIERRLNQGAVQVEYQRIESRTQRFPPLAKLPFVKYPSSFRQQILL